MMIYYTNLSSRNAVMYVKDGRCQSKMRHDNATIGNKVWR